MKITKTRLTQIIKEELARLTEADWDHPPEPAGSLGGYGDTDLYAEPDSEPGSAAAQNYEVRGGDQNYWQIDSHVVETYDSRDKAIAHAHALDDEDSMMQHFVVSDGEVIWDRFTQ